MERDNGPVVSALMISMLLASEGWTGMRSGMSVSMEDMNRAVRNVDGRWV